VRQTSTGDDGSEQLKLRYVWLLATAFNTRLMMMTTTTMMMFLTFLLLLSLYHLIICTYIEQTKYSQLLIMFKIEKKCPVIPYCLVS